MTADAEKPLILAPLRGVTVRCFRAAYASELREAGFTEAVTPFVCAMPGIDPLKDRELSAGPEKFGLKITPQFIGKDPEALRSCLQKIKDAGYTTADLNCGCPFPMVRKKGRGSGILKTPDTLRRMIEAGVETMGEGNFSVKARIGVDRRDELISLMPLINEFPLRFLTVHGRLARQMYEGECDTAMVDEIERVSKVPVVRNGDIDWRGGAGMVGRSFIRYLGTRDDIADLLDSYIEASRCELHGERPVLGRMKELLAYWKDFPRWSRVWKSAKMAKTLDEFKMCLI